MSIVVAGADGDDSEPRPQHIQLGAQAGILEPW